MTDAVLVVGLSRPDYFSALVVRGASARRSSSRTTRHIGHEALKRGDAGAIGVNYTSWVNGVRNKDTSMPPGSFSVIARSGDLPNDLLMAGSHVDPAAVEAVRRAMAGGKAGIIEAILSVGGDNEKFGGMDFVAIDDNTSDSS